MNSNPQWLASRTITAIAGDGRKFPITLRIGTPYEVSEGEWACPAAIDGLQERLHDIHGIDAWQTLQLVQSLQAQLLGYFVEDGGKLFWAESGEMVKFADLFARVPSA